MTLSNREINKLFESFAFDRITIQEMVRELKKINDQVREQSIRECVDMIQRQAPIGSIELLTKALLSLLEKKGDDAHMYTEREGSKNLFKNHGKGENK